MAIEDGAALGILLKGSGENDIADSLTKFEKLRKNRAARVQILSSVRAGRETEVQEKLTKYLDSDVSGKLKRGWIFCTNASENCELTDLCTVEPPATNRERCIHDWGYVPMLFLLRC
jgi:salicylate hydroxylase